MARCGAVTAEGTPCRRLVKNPGDRCWQHPWYSAAAGAKPATPKRRPAASQSRSTGTARRRPATGRPALDRTIWQPPAPASAYWRPPEPPAPPSRRAQEHERVRQAAVFCADSLSDGWQEAVADRITGYAGSTWQRLKRSHRKRNCKALARIARSILEAKTQIHKAVGRIFGWAAGALGTDGAARAFTEELASKIPLSPIDAKMVAVARGVQVAGILLCLMDDRDLTECQCFIDLAVAETKERVNQILVAAMSDWTGLARFTPAASRSVH
jgi:hypothetical protein